MEQTHTVGESGSPATLREIAKAYGVSHEELKSLNPQLNGRKRLKPGEVVRLPTCMETGDIKLVAQPCPKKKKVVAIDGPKPFRLCEPALFKVSQYEGDPTPEDKRWRIRWILRDAETKEDLLHKNASSIELNGETIQVECVPFDWHGRTIEVGAQFDLAPDTPMFRGAPESCTLYDWIATIKRAEAEYPDMSGVDMTNSMRRIAGYDTDRFQDLYESDASAKLTPAGTFTDADIKQLKQWTSHGIAKGVEVGIVEDPLGNKVAAGHVLTGLSGGVYRDSDADVTPWYSLTAGETFDNLYGATISGDLGQSAVLAMKKAIAVTPPPPPAVILPGPSPGPYVGVGTDATDAELIGDIDGWLLGKAEKKGGSGRKLSETLLRYYCPCRRSGLNYKKRFKEFAATINTSTLIKQVERFASTYAYSKLTFNQANAADWGPNSSLAVADFMVWLSNNADGENST